MNKIINSVLFLSLFFIISISLLSLQNNDIKIPQTHKIISLDLKNKLNLNLASKSSNTQSENF